MKYTPNKITSLNTNEVFVFGSNEAGNHAGGAVKAGKKEFTKEEIELGKEIQ